MGFFIMVFSMLAGIFFIAIGFSHRKNNNWHKISIVLGVILVFLAIYLGLPK